MTGTYSFLDVQAAIIGPGGSINLGAGSANSEDGITIEPTESINTMTIGADGKSMHSLHANKSGKISVRLLKTSPVNQQLAQLYAFQTSTSANHGQNTLTVSNPVSGDVITCQQVAFEKHPNLEFKKEGGMNEWTFHAGIIDRTLGQGN